MRDFVNIAALSCELLFCIFKHLKCLNIRDRISVEASLVRHVYDNWYIWLAVFPKRFLELICIEISSYGERISGSLCGSLRSEAKNYFLVHKIQLNFFVTLFMWKFFLYWIFLQCHEPNWFFCLFYFTHQFKLWCDKMNYKKAIEPILVNSHYRRWFPFMA